MGSLSLEIRRGYPLYHYHERPDFGKDHHAKNKYMERESRRLKEGWEGLTGFDYFDLAKNKLHDPTTGEIFNPPFLYDHKELNDTLLWCQNHKMQIDGFPADGDDHPIIIHGNTIPDPYDLVCIKGRRFGWTSKISSFQIYNAWKNEGCTQGATSCDDNRLKDLVSDKLFYSKQGCVEEKLLTEASRWNSRFVSFSFQNGEQTKKSTIWTPNTSNDDRSAQSPEGYGYATYFLDEVFLHQRDVIVTQSVKMTLINRKKEKVGIMIRGGSASEMTSDSIPKLRRLIKFVENPVNKTKLIFIPSWKCQVVDDLGFTLKDESMEKKLKTRADLRKAAMNGDSEAWLMYANEIKQNPFTIDELIGIVESDYFSPAILDNLNKGKIYSFNYTPRKCNLVNKNGGIFPDDEIRNIPDLFFPKREKMSEKFPYCIYEAPVPGDIYISGADPINFNGANEKGSMFAIAVKNVSKNKYVASAEFRTTDPSLGYNLFINLLLMYKSQKFPHGALCLLEKNAGFSIVTSCQMFGTLGVLAFDPFKKNPVSDTDRGFHKTSETMPKMMQYTRKFLETGYVPFEGFNDSFKDYRDDNVASGKADICDAVLPCETLYNTMFYSYEQENKPRVRQNLEVARDNTGRIIEFSRSNY